MPYVDFSQYSYFPSLLCGEHEKLAYSHLSEEDKEQILPIFELSRHRSSINFEFSLDTIREIVPDKPFIIDLDPRVAPDPYVAKNPKDPIAEGQRVADEAAARDAFNAELQRLLSSRNGFSQWRQLVAEHPNAIPMLQYSSPSREGRQILRQAAMLSRDSTSMAIRIKPEETNKDILEIISQIYSVLPSADQMLLIFDCGQGRAGAQDKINFVKSGIQSIMSALDVPQRASVRAVCMSNSFPSPNHDGLKTTQSYDWRIWEGARESFPFRYGDYAATFRPKTHSSFIPHTWRPTVGYAKDEGWLVNRDPNSEDPNGWVVGSETIAAQVGTPPNFDELRDCWGNTMIADVARNKNLSTVGAARFWHAGRINSHLHRQIDYAPGKLAIYEDDQEEND